LLSHRSGIPPKFTDIKDYESKLETLTPNEMLQGIQEMDLKFLPGIKYAYSNEGYMLLGKIIEYKSGKHYDRFIQEEIFDPIEMNSSGFSLEKEYHKDSEKTMALGHCLNKQGTRLQKQEKCGAHLAYSAGAMYSTVEDLAKWSKVLDGSTSVLSEESTNLMTTPNLNHYGYGLEIKEDLGGKMIHHDGGIEGFVSSFSKYQKKDLLVVILTNSEATGLHAVRSNLAKTILNPDEPINTMGPVPEDFDFSPYLKTFESEMEEYKGTWCSFTKEGDSLMFSAPYVSAPTPCRYLSNGHLYSIGAGEEFAIEEIDGVKKLCFYEISGEQFDVLKPVESENADPT
jgi:CubicO group peptidase (beta-lactamase class C family)